MSKSNLFIPLVFIILKLGQELNCREFVVQHSICVQLYQCIPVPNTNLHDLIYTLLVKRTSHPLRFIIVVLSALFGLTGNGQSKS